MSNYIKKAAAHARLMKLASAARLIRRQRALQKYAQAVQMQKAALSTGAQAGIGAGLGGLIGGGIGYGLGKKDKKLLSALIGAGAGAGIGGLGGYGLGKLLNKPKPDTRFNPYMTTSIHISDNPTSGAPYTVDEKGKPEIPADMSGDDKYQSLIDHGVYTKEELDYILDNGETVDNVYASAFPGDPTGSRPGSAVHPY